MSLLPGARLGPYEIVGPLGSGGALAGGMNHQYDVTPDGQRFLILTEGETGASPFNVVVNWPAALKK